MVAFILIAHCNLWTLPLSRGERVDRTFKELTIKCSGFPSTGGVPRRGGVGLVAAFGRARFFSHFFEELSEEQIYSFLSLVKKNKKEEMLSTATPGVRRGKRS